MACVFGAVVAGCGDGAGEGAVVVVAAADSGAGEGADGGAGGSVPDGGAGGEDDDFHIGEDQDSDLVPGVPSTSAPSDEYTGERGPDILGPGEYSRGTLDAPEGEFVSVSAGDDYSCGLRVGGAMVCWGDGIWGQAEALAGEFVAVSAGVARSCAVHAGGTVECWGMDRNMDEEGLTYAPPGEFVDVSTSSWHSCGLRADGTAECWGSNTDGQADAPAGEFVSVLASHWHSCGLRADGAVECWGWNKYGQTDAPPGARRRNGRVLGRGRGAVGCLAWRVCFRVDQFASRVRGTHRRQRGLRDERRSPRLPARPGRRSGGGVQVGVSRPGFHLRDPRRLHNIVLGRRLRG